MSYSVSSFHETLPAVVYSNESGLEACSHNPTDGSFTALVFFSVSIDILTHKDSIYFPLIVTAIGIVASFISQFFAKIGPVNRGNVEDS